MNLQSSIQNPKSVVIHKILKLRPTNYKIGHSQKTPKLKPKLNLKGSQVIKSKENICRRSTRRIVEEKVRQNVKSTIESNHDSSNVSVDFSGSRALSCYLLVRLMIPADDYGNGDVENENGFN